MRILFTVNVFRATDTVDHIRKISVEISRTHKASLLSVAGFDAIRLYYTIFIFLPYMLCIIFKALSGALTSVFNQSNQENIH